MLREVLEMGFDHAELSHGTRISLLPGILEAVDAGEIQISSLHNFCPLPIGISSSAPNLYQFSSDRPRERELALRYTLKTLDLAARVKAPVVVLHLGSVEMRPYTDKLLDLVARGERESTKYERLCADAIEKREGLKEAFFERTKDMIKQLLPEAEQRGVKLGVENREALEELPFESDFHLLFRELSSPNLVYWHDTGHAQIKENLGFVPHVMHLESLRERLFGLHLHDVRFPGRDHCAPGTGMIDFVALKPLIQPTHIKVFELSPSLSPEEVRKGVEHLRGLWNSS